MTARSGLVAIAAMIAHPTFDIVGILPMIRRLTDDDFDTVMVMAEEMMQRHAEKATA